MNCSSTGGNPERLNRDGGRISDSRSDVFPGGWGRAPLRGALKAMVGSGYQVRPLGQRVSLGQGKCGGHMEIVGEEPHTGGKALERCRVKTLQEVPGRPQGRKEGGAPGMYVESRPAGDTSGRPSSPG